MVFSLTFYLAPGSGKGNLKQKSDHLQWQICMATTLEENCPKSLKSMVLDE